MNFVQFPLKRVTEQSDAGIAPQCLQDAAGSGNRAHTHFGVSYKVPDFDRAGGCTR